MRSSTLANILKMQTNFISKPGNHSLRHTIIMIDHQEATGAISKTETLLFKMKKKLMMLILISTFKKSNENTNIITLSRKLRSINSRKPKSINTRRERSINKRRRTTGIFSAKNQRHLRNFMKKQERPKIWKQKMKTTLSQRTIEWVSRCDPVVAEVLKII